jgi:hypothetical protein
VFLFLLTAAVVLIGASVDAGQRLARVGGERLDPVDQPGYALPIAPWVRAADLSAVNLKQLAKDAHMSAKPSVLVETNYPAYDPATNLGDGMSVYLSIDANGYPMPVVMVMYWENRDTGDRFFVNAVDGLLPAGEVTDLYGSEEGIPVWTPTVDRLMLFAPSAAAFGAAPAGATDTTGRYQFVCALLDHESGEAVSYGNAMYNVVDQVVGVDANVSTDTTWDADNLYFLNTAIFVEDGATLTIEPGTVIMGDTEGLGTLIIAQGGKIMAEGTAQMPIIFTSPQPLGSRAPQDWGGLILNGYGHLNSPGGVQEGEGDTGEFGGGENPDDDDNSGNLIYVRVEFAGIEFSPDNELNGIAYQGTGRGGVNHHVQVHYNEDDGIEFFGGATELKYALVTGAKDDSFDWTLGWTGKGQFWVVVQDGAVQADHGFESDNWEDDMTATPIANPQIYNATLVGSADTGDSGDDGLKLRHGTGGKLYNLIVSYFRETGLTVEDQATWDQANGSDPNLTLGSSIVYNNGSWSGKDNIDDNPEGTWQGSLTWFNEDMAMNRDDVDPMLANPVYYLVPDISLMSGSPATDTRYVQFPPNDGFFETVNYLGAVAPGSNWTLEGWTIWSKN